MAGGQGGSRDRLDQERAQRMRTLYEEKGWLPAATLAGRDDPNHKQMRAMFNEAFRPKRINAMDPFVRDTAYKLIDDFVDDGRCDWVRQYAVPLPLIVHRTPDGCAGRRHLAHQGMDRRLGTAARYDADRGGRTLVGGDGDRSPALFPAHLRAAAPGT